MNCDQVFDILTRGPFPTGTSCDEPVETHLNQCPGCRRLAEALRPALELFQESVDPEESRDLPGYWSAAATDRQRAVLSYAPEVDSLPACDRVGTSGAQSKNWSAQTAWRMAAMLALGVTLGMLFSSRMDLDGFGWSPFGGDTTVVPSAPRQAAAGRSVADLIELAALQASCLRNRSDGEAGESPRGDQRLGGDALLTTCCSGCHHAASERVTEAATMKVAQSCQLCHNDRPSPQLVPAP